MGGEWEIVELGRLVEPDRGISYGIVQPGAPVGDGVPIVRVGDVRDGRISTAVPLRVSPAIEAAYARTRLKGGELLLTLVGTVGEAAVVPDSLAGWNTARAVAVIPVRKDVGSYWVKIALRSPLARQIIDTRLNTTVQATLNLRDVAQLPIVLPPRREREAIAHILGRLDDKIELNRRMNETLEAMARALFKSWFVDFDPVRARAEGRDPGLPEALADLFPDSFEDSELGRIPIGWEDAELGQLLEFSKGRKPPATEDCPRKGLAPVILIDTLDAGGSRFASPDGLVVANAEDTLMVMDGASSGRVEAGHEGIVGSTIARLTSKRVRPGARFLYHVLKQFEPQTREHLTGTSIPHADKAWITRQRVALSHDVRLLDWFEGVAGAIRDRLEANKRQSRTLAALRDTLLPKLISGELRLKDAEGFASATG